MNFYILNTYKIKVRKKKEEERSFDKVKQTQSHLQTLKPTVTPINALKSYYSNNSIAIQYLNILLQLNLTILLIRNGPDLTSPTC